MIKTLIIVQHDTQCINNLFDSRYKTYRTSQSRPNLSANTRYKNNSLSNATITLCRREPCYNSLTNSNYYLPNKGYIKSHSQNITESSFGVGVLGKRCWRSGLPQLDELHVLYVQVVLGLGRELDDGLGGNERHVSEIQSAQHLWICSNQSRQYLHMSDIR